MSATVTVVVPAPPSANTNWPEYLAMQKEHTLSLAQPEIYHYACKVQKVMEKHYIGPAYKRLEVFLQEFAMPVAAAMLYMPLIIMRNRVGYVLTDAYKAALLDKETYGDARLALLRHVCGALKDFDGFDVVVDILAVFGKVLRRYFIAQLVAL